MKKVEIFSIGITKHQTYYVETWNAKTNIWTLWRNYSYSPIRFHHTRIRRQVEKYLNKQLSLGLISKWEYSKSEYIAYL